MSNCQRDFKKIKEVTVNDNRDQEDSDNDNKDQEDSDNDNKDQEENGNINSGDYCSKNSTLNLKLRVHLMRDITMTHKTGSIMTTDHITPNIVRTEIVDYINNIYNQANLKFKIEDVIEENVIKSENYQKGIEIILNAKRDSQGKSDPSQLKPLYDMMDPSYQTKNIKSKKNLYHVYIFPFIGNTSQGIAIAKKDYNFHVVVGAWTNKFNRGGKPDKQFLTGSTNGERGSLSRTIAHEVGHVLGLKHIECSNLDHSNCLMTGSFGISLDKNEIATIRKSAMEGEATCNI